VPRLPFDLLSLPTLRKIAVPATSIQNRFLVPLIKFRFKMKFLAEAQVQRVQYMEMTADGSQQSTVVVSICYCAPM